MGKITKFKLKKIFTIENLLCFFIVICPILDVSSFLFRNYFNTNFSISTFVRPIIPIIAVLYIFFKDKIKLPLFLTAIIYAVYAVCHLYVFYRIKTGCAYGNELRELQYLVNYTFMVMNLFVYYFFFTKYNRQKEIKDEEKGKAINKLKKSILIALTFYVGFMYLSLITGTASYTYPEDQMGLKGWFESGNSIGTIMILCLFIVIPMISKKNKIEIRIWAFLVTVLAGTYLTTILGTRTGLLGFILVVVVYIILCIIHGLIQSNKINKKTITIGSIIFVAIIIVVAIFGSKTFERRKLLQEREDSIYDAMAGQSSHVTGDMLAMVEQIKAGQMSTDYMSEEMQKTMLEVYDLANEYEIPFTNLRILQFLYQSNLVKNQDGISLTLFGNGYMTHYQEMIFEMEIPAFLFNFGVIGFFLYCMPFLFIAIYGIYVLLRRVKQVSVEYAMAVAGLCFAIIISFTSGYTFFNSSSMMMIVVLSSIIVNDIKNLEDNEMKIYKINEGKK